MRSSVLGNALLEAAVHVCTSLTGYCQGATSSPSLTAIGAYSKCVLMGPEDVAMFLGTGRRGEGGLPGKLNKAAGDPGYWDQVSTDSSAGKGEYAKRMKSCLMLEILKPFRPLNDKLLHPF